MRSLPPILALGLIGTLSGCSTWPPRRVPEPTTSAAQPVHEDLEQEGSTVEAAVAVDAEADAAGPETARRPRPATAPAELGTGPGTGQAELVPVEVAATPAADEPPAEQEAQVASDAAPTESETPGEAVQDEPAPAEPAVPAEPMQDQPAPAVDAGQAQVPVPAEVARSPHALGASGDQVHGSALFGAAVADAEGKELGRVLDLHLKTDGTLDCVVLIQGETRRAYSGVDLALDDLGDLRLDAGEPCEPGDPLRDGAPYRELFVGRQTSTVAGQLTAVETLEGSNPAVTVIKLRAANNHHHRVLVGPSAFLAERELALAVDQEVSIDGIETRDSKGKLWVAGALRTGGRELRLRAGNGQPVWDPAQLPIRQVGCCRKHDGQLSAFDLARWRVTIEGAPALAPCDLFFDRQIETAFLVLHHGDVERVVPWHTVAIEPDRTLKLAVSLAAIAAAPTLEEMGGDQDLWQRSREWGLYSVRPVQAAAQTGEQEPPAPEPAGEGERHADAPPRDDAVPSGDGDGLEPPDGAQR